MTQTTRATGIIVFVLGMLVMIGELTFAGPCVHDDGSVSRCANAGTALLCAGVLLAVLALLAVVLKGRNARIVLFVLCVVTSVAVMLIPGTIFPICGMATMHCQLVMRPFALVVGLVAAVTSVVGLVGAIRAK